MSEREFPTDSLEFCIYLTRREWQLVYSATFAAQAEDIVPGYVTMQGTLGALFRWGISYLQNECGYRFDGLHMSHDGKLTTTLESPLEPQIVNWLQQLTFASQGIPGYGPPRYEVHLPVAIAYAKQHVPEHKRIVEMMESALRDLTDVIRQIKSTEPDEETRKAIRAGLAAAQETVEQQKRKNGKGWVN